MPIFWTELIVAVLYVLLGPGAWLALAFVMVKGRKRMRLLERPVPELPHDQKPPLVSVLVPAKDERQQIEACLESILRQDHPRIEVIAIDDRSSDGTGKVLDALASRDGRVRVAHIKPGELPGGWGGKSFALHRGVREARGAWLLFVDADVRLEPDALRAALALATTREFDMISLLPRFVGRGFWEKLLQPLAGAATGAMFAIALTNANHSRVAFANGQFMLVRRDAYEKTGGHEAIRGSLSEDTAIARRMKPVGLRPRLAWGDEFASVRMYDSLGAIVRGWGRNFFVGSRGRPWRILAAIAFIVLCCFSCFAAIAWGTYRNAHPLVAIGGWGWIATGVIQWMIMTILVGVMYAWSRTSVWYALLFPVGAIVMLVIFAGALVLCATGTVEWRGTSYTRAALRAT